ncbi:MAG: sigma-54 dependent transcriptional regulator [Pseudomonadota bacterium]
MPGQGTFLVIDDDADVLTTARLLLRRHFGRILTTDDPSRIEALMGSERIDVFLLDMNFAIGDNTGADGLRWLKRILEIDPDAVVVLMTAFGDLDTAVTAMREGAADFVLKPWQNDKLVATLGVALALRESRTRLAALAHPQPIDDFVATSASMHEVLRTVERVAPTDATVLIRGENGTGKEVIARAIHALSPRANRPLVAVDLGAIPEHLFESELFGHRKGAFTDAKQDRAGRFQAAQGGTLFLDELGNLPLALQTRLLRVLESREVVPLGADTPVPVDVRLLAATNQDLEKMVAEGRFREDLLYRLNTIEVRLPPLRERLEDLPPLIEHLTQLHARKYRLTARPPSDAALAALRAHRWPGNVRELSHAVERALILGAGDQLEVQDFNLPGAAPASPTSPPPPSGNLNLEENERRLVKTALSQADGSVADAARALGITRAALYRRMRKFDL